MSTIILVNPFSGAQVERDASTFTEADCAAYAELLDEEERYELEGAESAEEWMVALVELLGPERAGIIVLGG